METKKFILNTKKRTEVFEAKNLKEAKGKAIFMLTKDDGDFYQVGHYNDFKYKLEKQ